MSVFKMTVRALINFGVFMALLLAPAGTLHWWRAWVFLGVAVVLIVAMTISLYRTNRALLEERMKPMLQTGQPGVDKILVSLFILTYLGQIVLIPLDVFRFHWLPQPPALVSSLGLALYPAGIWVIHLTFRENSFAVPVVKHQKERKHFVIDTGVYRLVRHPMYLGACIILIGLPLWLESYAAAVATVIPISMLAIRSLFEERFLRRELEGYEDYTRRVRYRLIPGVW
jgi:protein-S-isoprenylcysteine O-methyltransferase Ste14